MAEFQLFEAPGDAAIRKLCGAKVFERGQKIAVGGELAGLVRAGNDLFARCAGSMGEVYDVRATLENGDLRDCHCSCPFDGDGLCKHVVGLLLRLRKSPADFETLAPLRAILGELSPDELLSLAENMVRRAPALLPLLTLGHAARRGGKRGDLDALRPALRRALAGRSADEAVVALETTFAEASALETSGDWSRAGAIYTLLLEELVRAAPRFEARWAELEEQGYESDGDDSGGAWAALAFEGLERGLQTGQLSPELRENWTRSLWQVWQQCTDLDVFALPDATRDILARHASSEVWDEIEADLRAQLTQNRRSPAFAVFRGGGPLYEEPEVGFFEDYRREKVLEWLVLGFNSRGREAQVSELVLLWGSPRQKFEVLMKEGDFEAAEICARNGFRGSPRVFECAERLEAAGQAQRAARLGQEALESEEDEAKRARPLAWMRGALNTRALEWMTRFSTRNRRADEARTLAARLFARRPEPATLLLWKEAVALEDGWDTCYNALESGLPDDKLRLHLAICDARAERALHWFDKLPLKDRNSFSLVLASVCETDFPQRALELFQTAGELFVAARGESNPRAMYREAANAWRCARDLHARLGTMALWSDYLAAQRAQNSRLRALWDEVGKVGL